jgi:CheY-like chemotaxis protein
MVQDSRPKFLIVDDEPAVVELVSHILSRCADIRKAYDGEEAVSIAKEFRPDCVVTGVIMPRIGGFQEAIAILQFLPTCMFVFMSGSAHEPKIREEYEQLGPDIGPLLPNRLLKNCD